MSMQAEPLTRRGKKGTGAGPENKEVGQDRKQKTQGRAAALLVIPSLIVLGIVIVYPVIDAIIMSLQKDAGLDPVTGTFVAGGFAGLYNYIHWKLPMRSYSQ